MECGRIDFIKVFPYEYAHHRDAVLGRLTSSSIDNENSAIEQVNFFRSEWGLPHRRLFKTWSIFGFLQWGRQ